MRKEEGRGQGLGQEVRSHLSSRDIDKGRNAIRDEAADIVVAHMDVARFARNLRGLGKLDG